MQQKFLIPENTMLKVTDEQGIEVDEDVFPEVATVQDICFVIYTDYGKVIFLGFVLLQKMLWEICIVYV